MYFGWWGLKKHLLPFGSDTVTNFTDSYPQYRANPVQIAAECPDRVIWQPQYILKFFMHGGYRWQPPCQWLCTKPHRIDTLYGKKLILEPVPTSALVTSLTLNIVKLRDHKHRWNSPGDVRSHLTCTQYPLVSAISPLEGSNFSPFFKETSFIYSFLYFRTYETRWPYSGNRRQKIVDFQYLLTLLSVVPLRTSPSHNFLSRREDNSCNLE